MADVSVLGLGAMGSALARVLIERGHAVSVWNRTASKAEALADLGARVADSPAAALAASPVAMVCVASYPDAQGFLATPEAKLALADTTLVQLTTGMPTDAREGQALARQAGARYLDGAILAYPDEIGGAATTILFAGESDAWRESEPALKELAGNALYLGEAVGVPAALDSALLSVMNGMILGVVNGALICEHEQVPLAGYAQMLEALVPVAGKQAKHLAMTIAEGAFDDTQASLSTYAAGMQRALDYCRSENLDTSFAEFAAGLFQRALAAGHGSREVSALIEVLRR